MATVLHSSDVLNFQTFPAINQVENSSVKFDNQFPVYYHPSVGTIHSDHFFTPYMHVSNISMEPANDIELHDSSPSETININFFLEGRLDTRFSGIENELKMRPNQHNLVFSPEGSDINRFSRNTPVKMLHISLNKDFFISCLNADNTWSESVANNILSNCPFSGGKQNLEITPKMQRLLNEICTSNVTGPMRNLMLQSRILELLALQMEQFQSPLPIHQDVRYDEAEKLFQLKTYLDANFLTELNLSQLSRICLLNEFKVKKGFKLLFGITVFNYLKKLRMEYAGNLLLDSSLSVDETADILGYEHAQHFSAAFKKYMGVSPSHFQHNGQKMC